MPSVAALAAIGRDHQVLVVTHLAQVAAFADQQVLVSKSEADGRTVARVTPVSRRRAGGRALEDAFGAPGQRCGAPPRKRAARDGCKVRHEFRALR